MLEDTIIFGSVEHITIIKSGNFHSQIRNELADTIFDGLEGDFILNLTNDEDQAALRQQLCAKQQSLVAVMSKLKGVYTAGGSSKRFKSAAVELK